MSATPIRLSVVVPCYRSGAYLDECLRSVLAYEGHDIELIAVDDGSRDRTGDLLEVWADLDQRVRVVHLPTNVGPGPARNAGLERASGDYVWFVDSDDWVPESAIKWILAALDRTEPDVLLIDHAETTDGTVVRRRTIDKIGGHPWPVSAMDVPIVLRLAPSPCTKIARRALLEKENLRFPTGRYEDALFSRALLMAAESIDSLDKVCYFYRQGRPGSTTSSSAAWHFEAFDQYARLFELVDESDGRLDRFRPELFRVMIDHYLVILGHRTRLPGDLRRAFFHRAAEDFARYLPPTGYPRPDGLTGFKHSLLQAGYYPAYAVLRAGYRILPRRSPRRRHR